MLAARNFPEWYAFFGGEEMAISRDDAAKIWADATRANEERCQKLRTALIGLVGASNKTELEGIEALTRTLMAHGTVPRKNGTAMIDAIHAILETT